MVTRIKSPYTARLRQQKKRRSHRIWLAVALCGVMLYGANGMIDGFTQYGAEELHAGKLVQVYNVETQQVMSLDLEQYLVGVVAAEMPAGFALEALKAQAVAARTFALSRMAHPNSKITALDARAQLSTSPQTCQAWISEAEQKARWGKAYETYHQKIVQAVAQTAGQVLRYDDALIEPLYHASCGGGKTENAEEVWGNAKPYLVSVICNHPADPHSNQKTTMSLQQMEEKLGVSEAAAAGGFGDFIQLLSSTASDRVKKLRIGDKVISGSQLRSVLGLKSACLQWEIQGDHITFTTNGYGHGVGMCQYGANYYAEQQDTYQEILARYYPGTQLTKEYEV